MIMKAKFWLLALLLAFSTATFAQEAAKKSTPQQRVEKRVEKMQKSLMLDEATAAKFAPIYKEYLLELAKCRPQVVRGKNLADEQIKKNIEARMDAREKALEVEKKYYGKLEKILNAKQLQKVFGKEGGSRKGGDKKFAPRRDGQRMGKPMPKRGGKPGCGPRMNDCKKGDCAKAKECQKADCAKAKDCKKADCKKECKKADSKK